MSNTESRFDQHWVSHEVDSHFWLAVIGDTHQDIKLHSSKHMDKWCDIWKKKIDTGESVLLIGAGDYNDSLSYRERRIHSKLHESTRQSMAEMAMENALKFAQKLNFFKGNCIAWLTGNHDFTVDGNRNISSILSEQLGGKVCGCGALISITVRKKTGFSFDKVYDIWAHHGVGGGTTAGATFNSLDRQRLVANADLYLMGHDHKIGAAPQVILERGGTIKNPHIVEKQQSLVRTGSFLRGYVPGSNSYVAAKAMRPVYLGAPEIKITPMRDIWIDEDGKDKCRYYFETKITV